MKLDKEILKRIVVFNVLAIITIILVYGVDAVKNISQLILIIALLIFSILIAQKLYNL